MPLIARQRSRLAVLAVLALVGSLLAVSAVPAVAAGDEKPSQEAGASACVGAAMQDAGFTDMAGNFAVDAVNCLAHYMIAQGTSEGVFSPNASITRAQMAVFMARAAGVAGVELDDPEDQGLEDIGNWVDAIQDAINQVVAAGIMSGMDDMFNPTGDVSRQDMAVILREFIDVAQGDKYYDVKADDQDEPFTDLGSVPFAAYNAINQLYELGVAAGTGDGTTFTPGALVSRAQMAVFVTKALGHTNARPAGISIQGDTEGNTGDAIELTVSIRNADHQPVPDALVDIITTTKPGEAFDDDGMCVSKKLGMGEDCTISDGDYAMDPDGNADIADLTLPENPGTLTVWAWTGELGDKFDADMTDRATTMIDASLPAEMTQVTDDMKENATTLMFGDTVTYTLQLVDKNGDPVAMEGIEYTIRSVEADASTPMRPDTRTTEGVHKTDASGRIEVSYSADDPDTADTSSDTMTLTLTITLPMDYPLSNKTTGEVNLGGKTGVTATWSDADSMPTTLTLGQAVNYHQVNDDGVRNTVTATLVDQYGDPVRSKKIAFWSSAEDKDMEDKTSPGLGGTMGAPADHRTTSRSGVATKSYTRAETSALIETISADYPMVMGECYDRDMNCSETDDGTPIPAEGVKHYWAVVQGKGELTTEQLQVADTANNTLVVGKNNPILLTYKAGDQFTIIDTNGDSDLVDLEEFEMALDDTKADPDSISATIGDDEDDINAFTLHQK